MDRFILLIFFFPVILSRPTISQADTNNSIDHVNVKIMKPVSETIKLKATSIGRLYPNREVKILAEISGKIVEYYFDVGDEVKKNQPLVKIDPIDYQLALEEAKAELKSFEVQYLSSQKKFKRVKKLAQKKIMSQEEVEDLETKVLANLANVNTAQIVVKTAEHKLSKTTVKAPFTGRIADRLVEIGQIVEFGSDLFSLVDLSKVRAKVSILEEDYVHLDKNDPVSISIDAYPGKTFTGKIDKIGITADQKTFSFPVEVVINNHNLLLKAGFSARVSIILTNLENVFLLPVDAVIYENDGAGVFVVNRNNTVQRRLIRTGKTDKNRVPVFDGLSTKDRVIIRGQNNVLVGSKVIISN